MNSYHKLEEVVSNDNKIWKGRPSRGTLKCFTANPSLTKLLHSKVVFNFFFFFFFPPCEQLRDYSRAVTVGQARSGVSGGHISVSSCGVFFAHLADALAENAALTTTEANWTDASSRNPVVTSRQ